MYFYTCKTCQTLFSSNSKKRKYCSRTCQHNCPELKEIASKSMKKTNEKYKHIIIDRMKNNNPSRNPKNIEKMKNTKRLNGTLHVWAGTRGGNGHYTQPQIILSGLLGWEMELTIPTCNDKTIPKEKKFEWYRKHKLPTNYKVDIGNSKLKMAIEIDGKGHKWEPKKQQDQKKEQCLSKLGWKVLRFTNQEIMTNPLKTLSQIKKEIQAT